MSAVGLAVAGLQVATQQAAHADPAWAGFTSGNLDFNDSVCTEVPGPVDQAVSADLKRGRNVVQFNRTAYSEGPGPDDRVDFSGRGRIETTVSTSGRYLDRVQVKAQGRLKIDPTPGHNCDPDGNMNGGTVAEFEVKYPGWVKISASAQGEVGIIAGVVNSDNINESTSVTAGLPLFARPSSQANGSTVVSPGPIQMVAQLAFTDQDLFGSMMRRAPGDAKASASIVVIREGAAKGSAKGSGKKYAKPASQRKCSAGKLPITLAKKAKKAKKIEVYAGNKKVASYKGKPGNKLVKLPKKAATVKVVSKLKSGGMATVKRSYHACL